MTPHDPTPHRWNVLGGDKDQLKECLLCKALVLVVVDAHGNEVPCLAGFGPEYVEVRPAPRCPPTCEETRKVWHEELVRGVMES